MFKDRLGNYNCHQNNYKSGTVLLVIMMVTLEITNNKHEGNNHLGGRGRMKQY